MKPKPRLPTRRAIEPDSTMARNPSLLHCPGYSVLSCSQVGCSHGQPSAGYATLDSASGGELRAPTRPLQEYQQQGRVPATSRIHRVAVGHDVISAVALAR